MVWALTAKQVHSRRHEFFIVDIREGIEHLRRPLRGAFWMPNHEISTSWGVLPRDAKLLLFDTRTGHAPKATSFLRKMSLEAYYLRGGHQAWGRHGRPKRSLVHH